jgi:hypothetical protein
MLSAADEPDCSEGDNDGERIEEPASGWLPNSRRGHAGDRQGCSTWGLNGLAHRASPHWIAHDYSHLKHFVNEKFRL